MNWLPSQRRPVPPVAPAGSEEMVSPGYPSVQRNDDTDTDRTFGSMIGVPVPVVTRNLSGTVLPPFTMFHVGSGASFAVISTGWKYPTPKDSAAFTVMDTVASL